MSRLATVSLDLDYMFITGTFDLNMSTEIFTARIFTVVSIPYAAYQIRNSSTFALMTKVTITTSAFHIEHDPPTVRFDRHRCTGRH